MKMLLLLLLCLFQPGLTSRCEYAGYPFFLFSNEVLLIGDVLWL
jgi:hypothetical protein